VQVCDALRASVAQGSRKLFLDATPSRPRGAGRPDQRKTQKSKFVKIEISNLQNRQKPKLQKLSFKNVFCKIDPEIVLVLRSAHTLASSSPYAPFEMCEVHI
jgi:hypothetical protein